MPRQVICLYDLEEPALIIECPTGVIYTNQAGGNFCMQPEVEGALVPLGNGCNLDDKLTAYFESPGVLPIGLTPAQADAIERILRTPDEPAPVTPTFFLEVDRSRLADSMEAWLYVTIAACPDRKVHPYSQGEEGAPLPHAGLYPFWGFGPRRAVLTWINSD